MTNEPDIRTEYFILAELMDFEVGGIDLASLAALLRDARGSLADEDYVGLQHDLRTLIRGR